MMLGPQDIDPQGHMGGEGLLQTEQMGPHAGLRDRLAAQQQGWVSARRPQTCSPAGGLVLGGPHLPCLLNLKAEP